MPKTDNHDALWYVAACRWNSSPLGCTDAGCHFKALRCGEPQPLGCEVAGCVRCIESAPRGGGRDTHGIVIAEDTKYPVTRGNGGSSKSIGPLKRIVAMRITFDDNGELQWRMALCWFGEQAFYLQRSVDMSVILSRTASNLIQLGKIRLCHVRCWITV